MKNYEKRQKKLTKIFGAFALIVIPIYTLLFALNGPLFETNLSEIGGFLGKEKGLIIWGTMSGVFFLIFLGFLFKLVGIKNKKMTRAVAIGCVMLLLAVIIPYSPEVFPFLSNLHTAMAFSATVLMVICIYYFIFAMKKLDSKIYNKALLYINIIVAITAIFFFLSGITSAVEITITIGMSILLFCCYLWLQKSEMFDSLQELKKIIDEKKKNESKKLKDITTDEEIKKDLS